MRCDLLFAVKTTTHMNKKHAPMSTSCRVLQTGLANTSGPKRKTSCRKTRWVDGPWSRARNDDEGMTTRE